MTYQVGDILVFIGDSKHFKKNMRYEISNISKVDYFIDELDTSYGKTSISFMSHIYGCYVEYADLNFKHISNYRDEKINKLLDDKG